MEMFFQLLSYIVLNFDVFIYLKQRKNYYLKVTFENQQALYTSLCLKYSDLNFTAYKVH